MPNKQLPRGAQEQKSLTPANVFYEVADDDLPTDEVMQALQISPDNFGDFILAIKFTMYCAQGLDKTKAAERIGIPRRTLYNEYWMKLREKAQTLIMGKLMSHVTAAQNIVFEKWPAIISRIANIALYASEDKDAISATELLTSMYPALVAPPPRDTSKEAEYLKQRHEFKPNGPLLAVRMEEGSILQIGSNPEEKQETVNTIDIKVNPE